MDQSDIPVWFHQVWTAVPSLGRMPANSSAVSSYSGLSAIPVSGEKSPELDRFESYVSDQLQALPSPPARIDLDRLIVRMAIKLHRTLAILKSDSDRIQAMLAFLEALETIEELRLNDVEPPELVREVRIEVPTSPPVPKPEPGGLWFTRAEDVAFLLDDEED